MARSSRSYRPTSSSFSEVGSVIMKMRLFHIHDDRLPKLDASGAIVQSFLVAGPRQAQAVSLRSTAYHAGSMEGASATQRDCLARSGSFTCGKALQAHFENNLRSASNKIGAHLQILNATPARKSPKVCCVCKSRRAMLRQTY